MILVAVSSGPCHRYAIMRDVAERSDGAIVLQSGARYRTIRSMVADSFVTECAPTAERIVRRRSHGHQPHARSGARVLRSRSAEGLGIRSELHARHFPTLVAAACRRLVLWSLRPPNRPVGDVRATSDRAQLPAVFQSLLDCSDCYDG